MKRFLLCLVLLLIPACIGCVSAVSDQFKLSVRQMDIAVGKVAPEWRIGCETAEELLRQKAAEIQDPVVKKQLLRQADEFKDAAKTAPIVEKWVSKLREWSEVGDE